MAVGPPGWRWVARKHTKGDVMDEPTSAAEIKSRSRQLFTAPSGNAYLIRRVGMLGLVGIYGTVPDLQSLAGEGSEIPDAKVESLIKSSGAKISAHFALILKAGLLKPKVGVGADEIEIEDIPTEDQAPMVTAILHLSGLNRDEADKVRPTTGSGESSGPSTSSPNATESGLPPS